MLCRVDDLLDYRCQDQTGPMAERHAIRAIAVWSGVLGSLLLLFRKSVAVWFYLASLICMVITTVHTYALSSGMEVIGDFFSLVITAVIFLFALALFFCSRAMRARNVLV